MANFYGGTSLIGGGAGALDDIDGGDLADGDGALVITPTGVSYSYTLDADSAVAESSPGVIEPDANAGNKRWILKGVRAVSLQLPNGTSINEFSTDGTFAGDSDDAVPTEKASGTRIAVLIAAARLHTMTNVLDHSAGNWKLFASNGSGKITEITHGAANKILQSNGATSAPTWEDASVADDAITLKKIQHGSVMLPYVMSEDDASVGDTTTISSWTDHQIRKLRVYIPADATTLRAAVRAAESSDACQIRFKVSTLTSNAQAITTAPTTWYTGCILNVTSLDGWYDISWQIYGNGSGKTVTIYAFSFVWG